MRLLLLQDRARVDDGLFTHLRKNGFLIDSVERLGDIDMLENESYDVLLVSSQLPDGSGLDWVRLLRVQHITTPVLMLMVGAPGPTAQAEVLDAGADDFVVMPCRPELVAERVRALRCRAAGLATPRVRCGDVEFDLGSRTTVRCGMPVALTEREWNLVEALALRFDHTVPKAQVELLVQGIHGAPTSNALEVHLSNVRRKLGRQIIRTIRGVGYRLNT
ncbi:response regulator transcription factor [Variovorax sp. KBS0712]|uniref:winged helix-turn-helix domain-containing protein n=1 Tax=Variovorax TaxID=34072 RepID=UPI00078048E0|nr:MULTISPECIES: response regulator transcription factor [Variovorax]TSD61170.1 response regulator transcription factor [Variovorax sp. KBS0712]